MKLLHSADWHLGFRQFDALDSTGVNQREIDVAITALRAVDAMIAEQPDVIVIGGDIFHKSHPSNNAILLANTLFSKLRASLPNIPIIVVAGNHDAPKTADAGSILPLFVEHNVTVVQNSVAEFSFPELGLYVMAVPDVIGIERPKLEPTKFAKHRVLLMHGEIAGVMAIETPHDIPVDDLNVDTWSYVALGHYHVYREVAPRTYYSGSLDYTSSNVWGEMEEETERNVPGKGFIVHNLDTGEHKFVPVPPSRGFLQLTIEHCDTLTAAEIDSQILSAIRTAYTSIDNAVVRVILKDMPRFRMRELNKAAIRGYRQRALSFQLVNRAPNQEDIALDVHQPEQRRTLRETLAQFLTVTSIVPEVDRDQFVTSGLDFFDSAAEVLTTTTVEA